MKKDKGILYINGVYLDYDYKINTNSGVCYIKINLCGNGVCTKGRLGADLHKLTLFNNVDINDIYTCIDKYSKFFCEKTIAYNNEIYFIYVMEYCYYQYMIDNKFSDLD